MPDVEELKSRARRAESAGDHRLALEAYRQAVEGEGTDPDRMDPALRLRVAELHRRLGEPDRALSAYLRASELYARKGLVRNAIAVCDKVLGHYPGHVEAHRLLAELRLELGLTADARESLLTYLEEAAGRGRTAAAREAARAFLDAEPDQEVAVALAEMLAADGRTDRALEVLRRVWEERTGLRRPAGRIEDFARELDPGADLGEWTPVWPPRRGGDEEPAAAPAAAGGEPRQTAEAAETAEIAAAVEAPPDGARAADRPGEHRVGGAPPAARPEDNGAGTQGAGARAAEEGNDDGSFRRDLVPAGTAASGGDEGRRRDGAGDDGAAGPPPAADLRGGLRLVEEMLEVAPRDLDLHRRRVLYARRLDDRGLLERALVEMGRILAERGSHRGARLVLEAVREEVDPDSAGAAEALRRLEREEEMPPDRTPGDAAAASGPGREAAAVDRRFRRRLREALSASTRELAWLHAAAQSCGPGGEARVPGGSHELMGRYLLLRGRPSEAAEHLQAALDRVRADGERAADLTYHLGRAWRRAGRAARARDCFERLAAADPDFGAAWSVARQECG